MEQMNREINQNRAILISAALVTAILAMVASYAIVRYVIVKPVKHLRDVSDAIAAGKLTVRAQIQTGDEFEELSHAFNRMLHNLVAMQQELRAVNHDLDRKVDELAQANLALFEMNRLKSDFLATMSHELRTPLNSIIGFSEVLSGSDQLNERQRRYATNIQTSGKMLLGMINDILDLAKIESGKMEVRTEDFSIRDVCEALASLARPIAERKNIDLECRLDEAIPLMRQDPGKLRQVLYNLLSNAIKFTPEGGRVSLRAHAEGRFVVIAVADTGIGIAEEDRETIFEKFRQAGKPGQGDGVLTREHQGTGLGLSIVRELTKLLGGDVHLESRPGQGSTFTIRIPLQLPGNRKFEVNLSDERIDLTKARRIEARAALDNLSLVAPDSAVVRRGAGRAGQGRRTTVESTVDDGLRLILTLDQHQPLRPTSPAWVPPRRSRSSHRMIRDVGGHPRRNHSGMDTEHLGSVVAFPAETTSSRPRRLALVGSSLGLLLAAGLSVAWIAVDEPVENLRYGQFKQKLVKGEVRSVRVGPTEMTGELMSTPSRMASPSRSASLEARDGARRGAGQAPRSSRPRRQLRRRHRPFDGPVAS